MRIAKTFRFEAAHRLLNHDGKCRQLHGHSYVVRIAIEGMPREADGSSSEGMVVDFGDLSRWWRDVLEPQLDHRDLNETLGPTIGPTTAENIARWIKLAAQNWAISIGQPSPVTVRVWETATSWAEA